jgi:endonuclease YncB( thermonuclease family)
MRTTRSRLALLLAVLVLILATRATHFATSVLEGTVVKVADGDMITVLDSNRQQHRARIAGIDAPEKGQPFGNASRKSLSATVSGKEERVEFQKYDRYGRIVGKVWVAPLDCPPCGKTVDVGLAQPTMGMAWWYRYYTHEQSSQDQTRYEFAEKDARAKKAGCGRIRIQSPRGSMGTGAGQMPYPPEPHI